MKTLEVPNVRVGRRGDESPPGRRRINGCGELPSSASLR
ncbi:MAG: hypothetical protein RJB61_2432, partial [Actinomycetota bacterium]